MKKMVSIVLLLVVIMVLSMTGCNNALSTSIDETPSADLTAVSSPSPAHSAMQFESKGHYNMPGFGEEFFVYRFDTPNNDVVVYKIGDSIYLLGDAETDTSYCSMVMKDSQFIALSEKYLLFITQIGKLAVSIEEKENISIGENLHTFYFFDDLSNEERNEFIYPIAYEKITQ